MLYSIMHTVQYVIRSSAHGFSYMYLCNDEKLTKAYTLVYLGYMGWASLSAWCFLDFMGNKKLKTEWWCEKQWLVIVLYFYPALNTCKMKYDTICYTLVHSEKCLHLQFLLLLHASPSLTGWRTPLHVELHLSLIASLCPVVSEVWPCSSTLYSLCS